MTEPNDNGGLIGSVAEVDAQRARWSRYRATQAMTLDTGDTFAS